MTVRSLFNPSGCCHHYNIRALCTICKKTVRALCTICMPTMGCSVNPMAGSRKNRSMGRAEFTRRVYDVDAENDLALLLAMVALLLVPIFIVNCGKIALFGRCFVYCLYLLAYVFVNYCIGLHIVLCLSWQVTALARRSSRYSMVRCLIYLVGRRMRAISQGHEAVPHLLHFYLVFCSLWRIYFCTGIQWSAVLIFSVGQYMRGRHYGA